MNKAHVSNRMFKAGVALLLLSAPVLIPLLYEQIEWRLAARRYAVHQISALEARIGGHSVALRDSVTGSLEAHADVRTVVDGRDRSVPWAVRIRPQYSDVNRYWMRATLASWQDLRIGEQRVVVVQSNDAGSRSALQYRLLFVDLNGTVTEESFHYADRANPRYRVLLASYVSGAPMSFRFAWAYGMPGIWFPLVYPLLSGIAGVLLLGAGIIISHKYVRLN